MKITTLLIVLLLTQAHAEPPAVVDINRYPVEHWQLAMVTQQNIIDIDSPGFEFFSRQSCVREGIRRMAQSLSKPDWLVEAGVPIGFVCDYIEG